MILKFSKKTVILKNFYTIVLFLLFLSCSDGSRETVSSESIQDGSSLVSSSEDTSHEVDPSEKALHLNNPDKEIDFCKWEYWVDVVPGPYRPDFISYLNGLSAKKAPCDHNIESCEKRTKTCNQLCFNVYTPGGPFQGFYDQCLRDCNSKREECIKNIGDNWGTSKCFSGKCGGDRLIIPIQ